MEHDITGGKEGRGTKRKGEREEEFDAESESASKVRKTTEHGDVKSDETPGEESDYDEQCETCEKPSCLEYLNERFCALCEKYAHHCEECAKRGDIKKDWFICDGCREKGFECDVCSKRGEAGKLVVCRVCGEDPPVCIECEDTDPEESAKLLSSNVNCVKCTKNPQSRQNTGGKKCKGYACSKCNQEERCDSCSHKHKVRKMFLCARCEDGVYCNGCLTWSEEHEGSVCPSCSDEIGLTSKEEEDEEDEEDEEGEEEEEEGKEKEGEK